MGTMLHLAAGSMPFQAVSERPRDVISLLSLALAGDADPFVLFGRFGDNTPLYISALHVVHVAPYDGKEAS